MNQGAQKEKDDFLALASHQLRTPATGVKQYIGMLREGFAGPLTELQQNLVDKAYDSNERQLIIINEMLYVARADSGEVKLQKVNIDMCYLLKDILDEQQVAFRNKQQKFKIRIPDGKVIFRGDKQYLRMALENIVANATKYTPEGGNIKVVLKETPEKIVVEVKDTGVGVAEDEKELLFKKFSRIPNDLSSVVNGSGLGLYLAKNVVESHNGTIKFQSKVGAGSVVRIVFPKKKK